SLPRARLDPDPPSHPGHELVANVEPETRTSNAAPHLWVGAVELLEDSALLLGRDPETFVPDIEQNGRILRFDPNLDPSSIGGVLDCVLDEVHQDLPHLVPVGIHPRKALWSNAVD